ncbi:vitamin K epoxide reductase family protein [Arthrobacter castelli]|uniref:vitamin K epoxide reductase family protein n=1 Tax=Arthrobacter castelli TaxID=271431 RepID=UPI000423C605|nr:vitamin K epoxide reductase family protein [Arthrobacter castelli]
MESARETGPSSGRKHPGDDGRRPDSGPAARDDAPRLTGRRSFGLFLVITGAVAWLAAWVLVLERLALFRDPNYIASCDINPWVSCTSVMKTDQAALFGFPNPLIGIVAFAVPITTGMVLLAGGSVSRWYWIGLQTGVTLGMAFIGWLWFQSVYVIGALCPYCMVVWAMMIPMFVWVTVRNANHGVLKLPDGLLRVVNEWAWVLVALAYLGIITSIIFRFFIGNFG